MSTKRPISNRQRAANYGGKTEQEQPQVVIGKLTGRQQKRLRKKAGTLEARWSGRARGTKPTQTGVRAFDAAGVEYPIDAFEVRAQESRIAAQLLKGEQ